MSIIVGPYFRGDLRAKPKQWGSISDVRSAIRHWFENIGLRLPFMYFPMWSRAVRNGEIVNFGSSSYTFGLNADTVVRDDFLDQNATDGGGLDSSASVDLSHTNQISIFMELIERYTGTNNRMLLEHSVNAGTNNNSFYINVHEVNDHAVGYFDRDASDYRNNKVCPANSFPANTRQNFCIVNDRNQAADDTIAIYVKGIKQTLTTRYSYNEDTSGGRGNYNMYLGARNISTEEMWMDVFIFALFDEALNEEQVGILSDQPFAALQPRSAPIYSFVTGGTTHQFSADINGVSSTPDIALAVARELSANIAGATATSDAFLAVARILAAAINAATDTAAIALAVQRTVAANISATSNTSDIELLLSSIVTFAANISGQSVTPDIALAVARRLAAAPTGQSATTDIVLSAARQFNADINVQSLTSAIDLVILALGLIVNPNIRSLTVQRSLKSKTPQRSVKGV